MSLSEMLEAFYTFPLFIICPIVSILWKGMTKKAAQDFIFSGRVIFSARLFNIKHLLIDCHT